MNPNNTSWNSTKSKSSSKSSENSRTTDKKSIKSLRLSQSNSQDLTSSDHKIFDQKWLDELVQLRYVKFIPFEEFEDPKIIERGSNGDISSFKCLKWRKMNKRVVVIKELKNIVNLSENLRESFVKELQWHLNVDFNERIIRISGLTQESPQSVYLLVVQHADGGSLYDYLSKNFKRLSWNDKLTMAKEIAEGLRYLHTNNIVHGNLNSRNVMFIQQKLKLTDFGITHTVVSTSPNPFNNIRKISYTDPQILTVYFLHTQKSDIYSLGVLFWELSCGRTPFSERRNPPAHDLANAIIKGLRELPTKDVPIDYLKLYTLCWDMDPEKRPESENVVMMCKELINNGDSTKDFFEKNGKKFPNNRTTIYKGNGMTEQNSKRMTRISDYDWVDLQSDALAAELWLHNQELEEKRQMGLIEEGDEYYGQEYGYSSVEQSAGQQIEGSQQIRQSQDLEAQRMKGQKWKDKAKNLVKRLSGGRKSRLQDFNNLNIYEDGLDEEDIEAGWTSVNIDEINKIDPHKQISQIKPIIDGKKSDNGLMGHGSYNSYKPSDNLDNLEIGEPGPSTFRRPTRYEVPTTPKTYIYSDHCKLVFLKNRWKINSQPCYAAYHARIGDLQGISWHVEHSGDWVLNGVQEISSPRNSYRRPLEALPLEAIMYCPAKKLLPTLTFLKTIGSNLKCIDSYTGGTCINFLSYNNSLLTTSYKSNDYSVYNQTTFNYTNTQGIYFKKVLLYLLEQGLDINSQNYTGDTLLSSLLFKWHSSLSPSIIEFLIEQGSNPNLENIRGGTPLGYTLLATRFENAGGPFKKVLKILKILLKGGGECNQEIVIPGRRLRNLGWVCVDISANLTKSQQKILVELLIEWGCEFGTWGHPGTTIGGGILNTDYSEEIDAIYDETDDDGNESPVLPSSQGGGSLLTKRLKGKNLKFDTPIKIPPLLSSPPTSPLPPTSSLPPIPVLKLPGSRGILTARDIPVSLLRPSALNTQIPLTGSRPRSISMHRLSLFFNPSPTTPMFKPTDPQNILVYAVQLNRLDIIKILLKRIYELSESKSIIAALKECGVNFTKIESDDDDQDNNAEEIIISKEKYGFFEHLFKHHDGKYEIRKYLMTWYGKHAVSKRKKTLIRIERMKQKWTNKAKNGYFSSRGIDAEFTLVESILESPTKSDLELINIKEKEE
ncbi:23314_t:CDS:10 [Cetraspora pellucida]|uniref:23314_t:CDS:1 n=1 Tax=Cetraspora pellucida TaxID=1433469 RepID=A0A9N8ZBG4_9GLOM|nr:23314_t:CDS:10 [Cetraspora pellucida]